MNDPEMKLDAEDVSVEEILLAACEKCEDMPTTHIVVVDFRNAGIKNQIGGKFCKECADELMFQIRGGL